MPDIPAMTVTARLRNSGPGDISGELRTVTGTGRDYVEARDAALAQKSDDEIAIWLSR